MENLRLFWAKNKTFVIRTFIVIAFICFACIIYRIAEQAIERYRIMNYPYEVMRHEAELSYNEYKSKLVKEVRHYIDSVAPSSSLNAYAVVDLCERYDMDIKFVLAQGQIESHFGTTGMAKKTNSIFNVGAFDKFTIYQVNNRYKYRHPDHSIEPYIRLLYRDYIVENKTELDLMGRYVNRKGQRYSSNTNYETELLKLYRKIDKTTKISNLQSCMRRYKIICGG